MIPTKSEVNRALGLSCVEKYFLSWLDRFIDVSRLYGETFITFSQVMEDFSYGATYQNYVGVKRVQDIAEEQGIVTHQFISCKADGVIEILKKRNENELCLVRVNGNFFKGYKRLPWREDHYIAVDENLHYVNEYPLSEGDFSSAQFEESYDGALLIYATENLDVKPNAFTSRIWNESFELKKLPGTLSDFLSAIGVLRVARKRLEKYFAFHTAIGELCRKDNELLDKLYMNARMLQIKREKVGLKERCEELFLQTVQTEESIFEEIQKWNAKA